MRSSGAEDDWSWRRWASPRTVTAHAPVRPAHTTACSAVAAAVAAAALVPGGRRTIMSWWIVT